MQPIGFIGLGNIGKPIAEHLLDLPQALKVYDIDAESRRLLQDKGATACDSVRDLATDCQYIGICVRDDNDVENLLYGDNGLLQNAPANCYIAIHSTVTRANLLKWAQAGTEKQLHIFDAPITGGASGAQNKSLCYMVGADDAVFTHCQQFFQPSADKIIHAGALGSGIALKLCNNLITYAEFTAMSEATRLAQACGLSADVLREVGKSNGVINEQMHQFVRNRDALMQEGAAPEMSEMFAAFGTLGEKDLQCALTTAKQLQLELPATELIKTMIKDVFLNKA